MDCLPIILLWAVRSINLTFARYSPVLEIQNDRILFWFYLLRDHSKRVSVASFDKQVKLKYPRWYISQTPSRWTAKSATLFLFISSWFIFLGFIDNHFNGPTWCMTLIWPFICNGTSLRYLTLKRLSFRQGGGIAYATLFHETSKKTGKNEVHFQ